MYYRELFKLCGYNDKEIEHDAPRIERVFARAGIGTKEVDRGVERLHKYFWVESEGVRKAWGIWMKQFIDLTLAREEHDKLIYYTYPLEPRVSCAVNCAGAFAQTPEFVNGFILGYMFGMLDPYFDIAEQNGMPPGTGMCGLNKIRLASFLKGLTPLPDLLCVSSFFCDNESKTDELISYHFPGIPRIYIDNVLDSNWEEWAAKYPEMPPHRVAYFAGELEALLARLRDDFGVNVTEEHLRTSRVEFAKLWIGFQRILECMRADPIPISNNDLTIFAFMVTNPERRTMAEGMQAIELLVRDARRRIERGEGVVAKGSPRVAWCTPWLTDPAINPMIEETGLAPVLSPIFWVHPSDMVRSKYTTFAEKTAEAFLRMGLMHSTQAFIWKIEECIKHFNLDGLFWDYGYPCRPTCGHAFMVKKLVEEDLGVPVLLLESEQIDSRDTPIGALRTRVEAFAEMLRIRKAQKKGISAKPFNSSRSKVTL